MNSTLVMRGVSCGYGDVAVLRDIDLTAQPGECIALLGPNGSGKSTLLKAITKTVPILSGSIVVEDASVAETGFLELARRVSFVPQDEPIPFPFTVREMVTMGRLPHARGLRDTAEDEASSTQAMTLADCLHVADRPVTELSGGERQRVLVARALAQECAVMLLDEPTAHLDVAHQMGIAELMKSLAGGGATVLAAMHDLNLATLFATRAILLVNGSIGLDAPMEAVLHSPLLDEVYQVEFERIVLESGRTALLPRA